MSTPMTNPHDEKVSQSSKEDTMGQNFQKEEAKSWTTIWFECQENVIRFIVSSQWWLHEFEDLQPRKRKCNSWIVCKQIHMNDGRIHDQEQKQCLFSASSGSAHNILSAGLVDISFCLQWKTTQLASLAQNITWLVDQLDIQLIGCLTFVFCLLGGWDNEPIDFLTGWLVGKCTALKATGLLSCL